MTIICWFKSITQLSIFVLWWISLRSQKCHCKPCLDSSLKPTAFLSLQPPNMASKYSIEVWPSVFLRGTFLLHIPNMASRTGINAALRTALSCDIFSECLVYAIKLWGSKSCNVHSKLYFYRVLNMENKRASLNSKALTWPNMANISASLRTAENLVAFATQSNGRPFAAKSKKTLPCMETTV